MEVKKSSMSISSSLSVMPTSVLNLNSSFSNNLLVVAFACGVNKPVIIPMLPNVKLGRLKSGKFMSGKFMSGKFMLGSASLIAVSKSEKASPIE